MSSTTNNRQLDSHTAEVAAFAMENEASFDEKSMRESIREEDGSKYTNKSYWERGGKFISNFSVSLPAHAFIEGLFTSVTTLPMRTSKVFLDLELRTLSEEKIRSNSRYTEIYYAKFFDIRIEEFFMRRSIFSYFFPPRESRAESSIAVVNKFRLEQSKWS